MKTNAKIFILILSLISFGIFAGTLRATDNYLPEDFFRNKPPLNERDLKLYEEYLNLLHDENFERGFVEPKLSKDFKVKVDRIRFVAVKVTIIVILEVSKNSDKTTGILLEAYGPDAMPTEFELNLVKPRLNQFAVLLHKLEEADVVEIPYFYYLFKL
ncbi:MAG: hypothetical protein LBE27_03555 [Deltaproteobacteria bacterium]|jgi:hypothetical protein|nr:hypothetical protein [Deltaproteobacteria bacterium]